MTQSSSLHVYPGSCVAAGSEGRLAGGGVRKLAKLLRAAAGDSDPPRPFLSILHRSTASGIRHPLASAHKGSIIYGATANLRAVQILLVHAKIEGTVRYLGVDVEDALELAERAEIKSEVT